MIPEFDENGYLPPGVHPATLEEIDARFGRLSELRRAQMDSVRWLLDLASKASVERIIINGSWVTDEPEPIDVDCVLLAGPDWGSHPAAEQELEDGVPFICPQIANARVFDVYVNTIFASDRAQRPKGMIEVIR
jgi:hypothetical protein